MAFLHRHVNALWQLSVAAPRLYGAILAGRHGTALRFLRTATLSTGATVESVVRLIERHGLLWCTNDLQMILARSALGARNPFGSLASTTQVEMKPERIVRDLKAHFDLLLFAIRSYATTAQETHLAAPKSPGVVPGHDDLAQTLKRRIEQSAGRTGVDLMALRPKLDTLVEQMRDMRWHGHTSWRDKLAKPVSANEMSAHFSGVWFSGLSHVQVTAVSVLRYLQAEVWIERMVDERAPNSRCTSLREHPAMQPFDQNEFEPGWLEQAKDLLFLYRRETLRDKMAPKPAETLQARAKNTGVDPIDAARKFLGKCPWREIGDDDGDLSSLTRTFYLIDLIPEARLLR